MTDNQSRALTRYIIQQRLDRYMQVLREQPRARLDEFLKKQEEDEGSEHP